MQCKRIRILSLFIIYMSISSPLVSAQNVLKDMYSGHPRLFLNDENFAKLKEQSRTDTTLARIVRHVIEDAEAAMSLPPLQHKLKGPRLLHVSRDCLSRIQNLALAYRWTGERKYADKAIENMLTVSKFPNWNPFHFLDVAEMCNAMGLGYDWLYHMMDENERTIVANAIFEKGLMEGINAFQQKLWYTTSAYNWNQVVNGGLIVASLAVAEEHPGIAERLVGEAVRSLPYALATYDPEGAWPEGPAYWNYATRYTAYALSALESALGHDFGLSQREGLSRAAYFPMLACGPTGKYLCFADAGNGAIRKPMGVMFWMAGKYELPFIAHLEHEMLSTQRATATHLLWYHPPVEVSDLSFPLDYLFNGIVPVAVFRSSWDDTNALFLGFKAGGNQVNHAHLDLGNFEIDALGERWAEELGADYYNLEGYWENRPGGMRWEYFRLNSHGHSVITINGENQNEMAECSIRGFFSTDGMSGCYSDLSNAYDAVNATVTRGVAMVDRRRAIVIQDELALPETCDVKWSMITRADISIQRSGDAVLSIGDKKMSVKIISPADATFAVESIEQDPPQASNEGFRRLAVNLDSVQGDMTLMILLAPHWAEVDFTDNWPLQPVRRWRGGFEKQ
ncbi:MAG: DUF4962 domain-containing protein [candidate division KSB1 bacterium]|jgi:hypothetical protein|nr:DUF4962 domain-containing protein [candidate division KSB1 bacterium]